MDASEYEEYVAELTKQLRFCRDAVISRNRKFRGKRQPGNYEVDVAVEVLYGDFLHFLMIIECKNWKRPVDRPVIQKLLQTRDAIAAHKAVVVSPVGFSDEAIAVAEANGVALWVICPGEWIPVTGLGLVFPDQILYSELRWQFLGEFEILPRPLSPETIQLRDFQRVRRNQEGHFSFGAFVGEVIVRLFDLG